MRNIKKDFEKWLFIAPFVLIFLLLIQVYGISNIISFDALKIIPEAVTYSIIVSYIFTKYGWKLDIFKGWVVPFPNLQGTWSGYLRSTWINPETNEGVPPILVIFVIRQSFDRIHITLFTKESESQSQASQFVQETGNTQRLKYTYTNRPEAMVRNRSEIHDGAANLKIIRSPSLSLKGEYWTSRKTTGSIKLERISTKLVDCFIDDVKSWASK